MKESVYKIGTPRRLLVHRGNERRMQTQHPRRRILALAAGIAMLPAVSRLARAQAYPTRPVRIIVPVGPGGANDIVARVMGNWLSERFRQQFVIENRPGAGGNIGTEAVVRAPPDGYTLLLVATPHAINATLYDKLNFNFIRDIAPVAGIVRFPTLIVVNPSVPANTIPEFIAYARANPGKVNMASVGIGSSPHVSGELFKMMAGVDMVHVPYRSGAAVLTDMLSGQVQFGIVSTASTIEYVRAGKLRALAVTTATRWEGLPAPWTRSAAMATADPEIEHVWTIGSCSAAGAVMTSIIAAS
jgi:tripartite-type tricarboxylate transporter receptor subunit TctC